MLGEHLGLPTQDPLAQGQPFALGAQNDQRTGNSARITENLAVELRPSSSSQRNKELIKGFCKNYSQTGFGVVSDFAPRVGDIYRLEVTSDSTHTIHGTHARCVRCHFLDEDTFDAGFCFLSSVEVKKTQAPVIPSTDPLV